MYAEIAMDSIYWLSSEVDERRAWRKAARRIWGDRTHGERLTGRFGANSSVSHAHCLEADVSVASNANLVQRRVVAESWG